MLLNHWLNSAVSKVRSLRRSAPRKRRPTARFAFDGAEGLESRQLLAADVALAGETILINSDNDGDRVVASEYNGFLTVTVGTGDDASRSVYGASRVDRIRFNGNGGNDWFQNNTSKPSQAFGGDGHDWLIGGSAADEFFGGDGNDWLLGQSGDDTMDGGTGIDRLYGGADNDVLSGGANNDFVYGDSGNDVLFGNGGDDTVKGGDGHDMLYGDTLFAFYDRTAGNDELRGGRGNDELHGLSGNDRLYGENGDDILNGGTGNDQLWGGNNNDDLNGQSGNDVLWGGVGDDLLQGWSGNDILHGESGGDELYGGSGDDQLFASEDQRTDRHADMLSGGSGDDLLRGIIGQDELDGGRDNDTYEALLDFGRAGRIQGAAITPGRNEDRETLVIDLHLGTFADEILQPFIEDVKSVIDPIEDVVDFIQSDIPVISDVLEFIGRDGITYVDIIERLPGGERVNDLIDFVNAVSGATDSIQVNNGAVRIGSVEIAGSRVTTDLSVVGDVLRDNALVRTLSGVGVEFDILDNPARVAEFFLGHDVNLISYDLPEININESITFAHVEIPVPVLSFIRIVGDFKGLFGFRAAATLGYDTYGLRTGDWTDGFFVSDAIAEVTLGVGLDAGLDALVAKLGANASVTGTVGVSLNDPNDDGKVRIDEVGQNGEWFDFHARMNFHAGIYVRYWNPFTPWKRQKWAPDALQISGELNLDSVFS